MDTKLKCYMTLVDSHIRDYGKAANDCAVYICDKMYELHIPIVGFILKKDSGMYIVVGEDFAKDLSKFWNFPCIGFNFEDYVAHTQDPFWLITYDNNDETKPRLMYYSK